MGAHAHHATRLISTHPRLQVQPGLAAANYYTSGGGGYSSDTFENVPGMLGSGEGDGDSKALSSYFTGENRKDIEKCTRKCVPTCIRGGSGPGLGPISMRKEVVVFKEGFRSRSYCLTECATVGLEPVLEAAQGHMHAQPGWPVTADAGHTAEAG